LEPRKNLDTLLDAWQRLPENLVRETPLVLVGGQGWHADDLVGRIAALCRQGSVIWPGHVSQDCLPSLYRGAALFVYPSVYEGFGLPVLEAMASGLPVVAGRGTPAEEFAAGCAKLVDTRDVDALAGAIADALSDLDWRQQAAQRGRAVAASMSWNECARAHADVWREAAGR
ncbi:MAG: glycosyltransferase family 4 protein, partial [Wenzhouxiangellaceae bacterium]